MLEIGLKLIAEEYVAFERELAVLVARSPSGQAAVYPVVQTVQLDGHLPRGARAGARAGAGPRHRGAAAWRRHRGRAGGHRAARGGALRDRGGLLVNELAMRPHNSGHWTIEGARTSQFEQHLRAVLDLPLGAPTMAAGGAVMVNVLGGADPDLRSRLTHVMAADPAVKVHLYGKTVRPGRKVGHVTALGDDMAASWPAGPGARPAT